MRLTAIIEREGDGHVSLCPELDIASQGDSVEQARENLREALALFFECASAQEVRRRLRSERVRGLRCTPSRLRVLAI
jgi:predicted RNase H-like HicB family nuclease